MEAHLDVGSGMRLKQRRCVMLTLFLPLLVATMVLVIGVPAAGFAQFRDKADHVELRKGTRLCSSIAFQGFEGPSISVAYFGE